MSAPLPLVHEGRPLASDIRWARTARARMRGLLGYQPLVAGQALVIEPAAQVHTFGLGYPIDVVFCDREGVVLRLYRRLPPRRVTRWVRGARYAIELPAGSLAPELQVGDRLTSGS